MVQGIGVCLSSEEMGDRRSSDVRPIWLCVSSVSACQDEGSLLASRNIS